MKNSKFNNQVDLISLIAKKHHLKKVGKDTYRVDPCPVCGHFEHFTVYADTNSYHSFSGCCKGGSLFDYLTEVEGLAQNEALQEYEKLLGVENEKPPSQTNVLKEVNDMDYTDWICSLYQNTTEEGKQHFINRGIPSELIQKYKLSVAQIENRKCMVLPIWKKGKVVHYTKRFLDDKEPKYKNASGMAQIFNIDYLKDPEKSILFITEGIFDALSLEAMGYFAIALGGVENADRMKEVIKQAAGDTVFLTAFDRDEAGKKCKAKFPYKTIEIPKQFKDINEWYVNSLQSVQDDQNSVLSSINAQLATAGKPDVVSNYLDRGFHSDIKEFLSYRNKLTGFNNLDLEMKGLYPGLYVIGGISSVGKTTFTHQLCDQLAEQGSHVIYFSLEQSRLEMVSKSIARTTAKINLDDAVPSVFIRSGDSSIIVKEAIKNYRKTAENISIIEGNFNTDINTIREYVTAYRKANKVNPIVVIDYLQIMPSLNERTSDKQRIDTNVTELKRMSRDFSLTVFVISSLNRGNYLAPIDFESFKESGGIEYTADVVWGLQLEAIYDPVFYKEKSVIEKRDKIKKAKNADPREIELVCLKNRNGIPSFSCSFFYHAKFDLFDPNFYTICTVNDVKTI